MSEKKQHETAGGNGRSGEGQDVPEWTNGLRHLYDSVVKEPLPDSFRDLLDRFDEESEDAGQSAKKGAKSPPLGENDT